jgi:predicted nucleic acid-binding Zn ribbon protein
MSFNRLIDILKLATARYPAFGKRLQEAEALSRWEAAVGPAIAKHARAIRVQDKVLWVEVDHSIWKSELHYRRRQILEKLNAQGQGAAIEDLLLLEARPGRPGG